MSLGEKGHLQISLSSLIRAASRTPESRWTLAVEDGLIPVRSRHYSRGARLYGVVWAEGSDLTAPIAARRNEPVSAKHVANCFTTGTS